MKTIKNNCILHKHFLNNFIVTLKVVKLNKKKKYYHDIITKFLIAFVSN